MAADRARQRRLAELESGPDPFAGRVATAAELAALEAEYEDLSLNPDWTPEWEEALHRSTPGETTAQTVARLAANAERIAQRERDTGISRSEVLQSDGAGGFNVLARSGSGYEVVGHQSGSGLVTRFTPSGGGVESVFEPAGFEPGPEYYPFGGPVAPVPVLAPSPPSSPSPTPAYVPQEEPMRHPGEPAGRPMPTYTPGEAAISIGGIISGVGGILGGGSPCGWTRTRYPNAAAAAAAFGQNKAGFATIDPGQNNGASTAYSEGGTWMVNMCRGGVDSAAGDVPAVGAAQPLPAGSGTIPSGPGSMPTGADCAMAGPVAPRTIVQRRCPPGMRLAKNDQCYPEKTLPKQWWKNDPKPAKISFSEWKNFQKATKTATKIEGIAEKAEELTGKKAAASARKSAAAARKELKMLTDGS